MQTQVKKWGHSLAVRIPKAFITECGLEENTDVDLSVVDGRIVLSQLPRPKIDIDALLDQITPENNHGEIDFGDPMGKEVW